MEESAKNIGATRKSHLRCYLEIHTNKEFNFPCVLPILNWHIPSIIINAGI